VVGSAQNQKQGSTLGAFYRTYFGRVSGTTFAVMPSKDSITRGVNQYLNGGGNVVEETCWPRPSAQMYLPDDDVDENLGAEN
jgi:hypothetical protein